MGAGSGSAPVPIDRDMSCCHSSLFSPLFLNLPRIHQDLRLLPKASVQIVPGRVTATKIYPGELGSKPPSDTTACFIICLCSRDMSSQSASGIQTGQECSIAPQGQESRAGLALLRPRVGRVLDTHPRHSRGALMSVP